MKLAPVTIATVLTSLCLGASAQTPAPPPTPSTAVAPAPPDGGPRKVTRYQTFTRTGPDGMRSSERMGPPGMWWKNPDIIQKLSITPDQQKRMDDIFQQSRLQLIDLKANVEKQEVTLEPMISANPPDTNKVLAQIDKVAQARAELEKANARMLLGIRTVLTPDQWTKLQEDGGANTRIIMRKGGPGGPGGFGGGFPGPGGPEGHFRYQTEIEDSPL